MVLPFVLGPKRVEKGTDLFFVDPNPLQIPIRLGTVVAIHGLTIVDMIKQ